MVPRSTDIGMAISKKDGMIDKNTTIISLKLMPLFITSEVSLRIRAVTNIPKNTAKHRDENLTISKKIYRLRVFTKAAANTIYSYPKKNIPNILMLKTFGLL